MKEICKYAKFDFKLNKYVCPYFLKRCDLQKKLMLMPEEASVFNWIEVLAPCPRDALRDKKGNTICYKI